jgi:hypothetical protein
MRARETLERIPAPQISLGSWSRYENAPRSMLASATRRMEEVMPRTTQLELPPSKAAEYRAKAAECEQRARQSLDRRVKQAYEEAARQWQQLAEQVHSRDQR